ncbi:hypothetical protein J6590_024604 [Homalodisca vitripennis]|nr:hypothetical protein J6590_024604 [Homalodisca vitripennis]
MCGPVDSVVEWMTGLVAQVEATTRCIKCSIEANQKHKPDHKYAQDSQSAAEVAQKLCAGSTHLCRPRPMAARSGDATRQHVVTGAARCGTWSPSALRIFYRL